MDHTALFALFAFALVSSITPGPNNLMLMASGANFGLRATLPHMLGVGLGFVFMIIMVGIGLVGLFDLWPHARDLLKIISIGYMLWLAWKIANAAAPDSGAPSEQRHAMTFMQAALFQWVNPKAWTMALTAVTVYAPRHDLATVLIVAGVFGVVNLPSVSSWAMLGQVMRRWLSSPSRLRLFNWSMAALLIGSLTIMI